MTFRVVDLGLQEYERAWQVQRETAEAVLEGDPDTLLLVRHPRVLTLGANFHPENLLLPVESIEGIGVQVVQTDRGGDVTYHGPGQLVIYPIFDIERHGKDLHRWMRDLEETIIIALADFGLNGCRFPPHTGVWVGDRKVAAIGVKVRRWVNLHGIALNCASDLSDFELIVPCGIREYGVTSLSQELGREVEPDEAIAPVVRGFARVFGGEPTYQ
ncbi:MAG TPA: lipoyl(octanoyl) transferase LipB [Fimbriimonadaceae bacterium]|nr:lipoyl(octanoyl) transferase LipB [Fimbriimonadaceae bacterium]HRJ96663.1 lipoyl(octanoyl) transferase LipB [Fimbriimonadaceae bacterium]